MNNNDIIEKYLIESNMGNKFTSREHDRFIITKFLDALDNKSIAEITELDVINYFEKLKNGIIKAPRKKRKYSDYSIAQFEQQIIKFFKWYYNTGDEKPNIVKRLKPRLNKSYKRKQRKDTPTKEEIMKLVDCCHKDLNNSLSMKKKEFVTLRDRAMIMTFYQTGCRLGEINNTKIGDISDVQVNGSTQKCLSVDGKTGQRDVLLLEAWDCYLKPYLELHPTPDDINAPLFVSHYGKKYMYSSMQNRFQRILKKSGIKKHYSIHSLRHARATELANHMTEAQLNKIFGWSPKSRTATNYVHQSQKDVHEHLVKFIEKKTSTKNQIEQQVMKQLQEKEDELKQRILKELMEKFGVQSTQAQDYLHEECETNESIN